MTKENLAKRKYSIFEILLWIAIINCFITATLAGNANIDKSVIATLSGLSGLIMVIAQKFATTKKTV